MNPPNNLVPLIDADIIVYRVGFANKEHEPLSYTLQSAKTVLDSIYNTFPNAPEKKVYLTGKGNFRDEVATLQIYKGNRDPNNKPEYYDEIREYIRDFHNAHIIEGKEADDALGIEQWKNKDRSTCIVSIDKDLLCIPGWHFNWVKGEMHYQTLAEADKMFWTQMLTGDSTDHVVGCGERVPKVYKTGAKAGQTRLVREGVGPKEAAQIIASTDGSRTEMHVRVLQEYERRFGSTGAARFHENGTLLWIMREEGVNYDGKPYTIPATPEHDVGLYDDDDIPF
jgi:hypothetical protein